MIAPNPCAELRERPLAMWADLVEAMARDGEAEFGVRGV
jgi:hypothetical protein